jgi:hypothetical protein
MKPKSGMGGCHRCKKCRTKVLMKQMITGINTKIVFQPFAEVESEQHGSMPTTNKACHK